MPSKANIQIGNGNQQSVVNNRRQHRARKVIVSEKRQRRNGSVKKEQSFQTIVDTCTSENRNGYGTIFVGSDTDDSHYNEQLNVECTSSIASSQQTCSKEVIDCYIRPDGGFTPGNGPEEGANGTVISGIDRSRSLRTSTMRTDVYNPSCGGSGTEKSGYVICVVETMDGESASVASSTNSSCEESQYETCSDGTDSGEDTRDGESASMASSTNSSCEESQYETCSDGTDSEYSPYVSIDNTDNPRPTLLNRERSMKEEIVGAIIEYLEPILLNHERSMKSEIVEAFKEYFEPLRGELVKRQPLSSENQSLSIYCTQNKGFDADDSSGIYENIYYEPYSNLTNDIVSESEYEPYQNLPAYVSAHDQLQDNFVSNASSTQDDYEFPDIDNDDVNCSSDVDDDVNSWGGVSTTQTDHPLPFNVSTSTTQADLPINVSTTQVVYEVPLNLCTTRTDHPPPINLSTTQIDHPLPVNPSTTQTDHPLPINASTTQTDHPFPINVSTTQTDHPLPVNVSTTQTDHPLPVNVSTTQTDHSLPINVSTTQTDHSLPINVSTTQTDPPLPINVSTTQTDPPLPINVSTTQAVYEVPDNLCTMRIDYQVPADSCEIPTVQRDYQLPCNDNEEVCSSVFAGAAATAAAAFTAADDDDIYSWGDDMYSVPECEGFQILIKLKLKNGWRTNKKMFQVTITAATTLQDLKMDLEKCYGCLVTVEYSVSKQGHVKNMSKIHDYTRLLDYGMTTGSTVCFKGLRVVSPDNRQLHMKYSQFVQHVDVIY